MTVEKALCASAFILCLGAGSVLFAGSVRTAATAAASSDTLPSGLNQTRTTIPITIDGLRTSCVLDTGSSAMLVSPMLAQSAHLSSHDGTFEEAPDGRTYVDRQTNIATFGVGGHTLRNVSALISSNLSGYTALCGYDFFAHFPTLIDRDRRLVTLFPAASKLARFHCLSVDLSPKVPLATIEINGTWLSHVVLDSGMSGGGALWDGVRTQLREPLVTDARYQSMHSAERDGFVCGASATIRYAGAAPASSMPICTEQQRPDGYNGIVETNLASVHAMMVDYPRRRICFDVSGATQTATAPAQASPPMNAHQAWSRFNALRPP